MSEQQAEIDNHRVSCEICNDTGLGPQGEPCLECDPLGLGLGMIMKSAAWNAEDARRWLAYNEQVVAWYQHWITTGQSPRWPFPNYTPARRSF